MQKEINWIEMAKEGYLAKRNTNIYVPVSTYMVIMAKNLKVAFPDEHYDWLEEVRRERGWDSIQEAVRSIVEDAYRMRKKILDTPVCAPAPAPVYIPEKTGSPAEGVE